MKPLLLYLLRLGALGFGGPIALVGAMQRDLVERDKLITEDEYRNGLALAQLAPGPLAAQLAMYLGWLRGRALGAAAAGLVFVLPSFLIVLGMAAVYLHGGGLPWMQAAFYGVGASVIAIIARSAVKLAGKTLGSNRLLWGIFLVNAAATAVFETEFVVLVVASGLVAALTVERPKLGGKGAATGLLPWFVTGLHGSVSLAGLSGIFLYFAQAGAFVFGSGLAIVPFLHGGVVVERHWLTEQQFLDAVAVAMLTPGPVVITVAFIGYLVGGPAGAVAAALGAFLPCYLFTVVPAPHFSRWVKNRWVAAAVKGVTAAATGAIAGSVFVLGRRALIDPWTVGICAISFLLLWRFPKVPEPILVVAAGIVGFLLKTRT